MQLSGEFSDLIVGGQWSCMAWLKQVGFIGLGHGVMLCKLRSEIVPTYGKIAEPQGGQSWVSCRKCEDEER